MCKHLLFQTKRVPIIKRDLEIRVINFFDERQAQFCTNYIIHTFYFVTSRLKSETDGNNTRVSFVYFLKVKSSSREKKSTMNFTHSRLFESTNKSMQPQIKSIKTFRHLELYKLLSCPLSRAVLHQRSH